MVLFYPFHGSLFLSSPFLFYKMLPHASLYRLSLTLTLSFGYLMPSLKIMPFRHMVLPENMFSSIPQIYLTSDLYLLTTQVFLLVDVSYLKWSGDSVSCQICVSFLHECFSVSKRLFRHLKTTLIRRFSDYGSKGTKLEFWGSFARNLFHRELGTSAMIIQSNERFMKRKSYN